MTGVYTNIYIYIYMYIYIYVQYMLWWFRQGLASCKVFMMVGHEQKLRLCGRSCLCFPTTKWFGIVYHKFLQVLVP